MGKVPNLTYEIKDCDEDFFIHNSEKLAELCRQAFHEHALKGLNFGPITMTANKFAKRVIGNIGQYVEYEGKIIAFWNAKPDIKSKIVYGDILAVNPKFKGKHVGRALSLSFSYSLSHKGFKLFITDTSLNAPHVVAFHKSYGCKAIGMKHFYKRNYRSVILRKALVPECEISDLQANIMYCLSAFKCKSIWTNEGNLVSMRATVPHLCGGEIPEIEVFGGEDGASYIMKIYREGNPNTPVRTYNDGIIDNEGHLYPKSQANKDNFEAFFVNSEENFGEYSISLEESYQSGEQTLTNTISTMVYIHHTQTAWRGTTDTEWDTWANWDYGVPWECTNVVIPAPDKLPNGTYGYPALAGGDYRCNNIHFCPGAQLKGQEKLRVIQYVFADMKLPKGRYHLVSTPLQGMVTGDMFGGNTSALWDANLSKEWTDGKWNYTHYFEIPYVRDSTFQRSAKETMYFKTYTEKRVDPIIYQRFWKRAVYSVTRSTDVESLITKTDWTTSFNGVNSKYTLSQAFAVRVDNELTSESGNHIFHFPKTHPVYCYYDKFGKSMGKSEYIDNSVWGKFFFPYKSDITAIYINPIGENNFTDFGNPFICAIDIEQFLSFNSGIITNVYKYENKSYVQKTSGCIEPFEGVLLELASDNVSIINIDSSMFNQNSYFSTSQTSRAMIEVQVIANEESSKCWLNLGPKFSEDYRGSEDALLILPSEERATLAVFSLSSEGAMSLQSFQDKDSIELGIYLLNKSDITFKVNFTDKVADEWLLLDEYTHKKYNLNKPIGISNVESCIGRFFLVKNKI